MSLAAVIQLIGACVGILGSLFFAIGIIRQNAEAMARLSYTYWDANPHMPAMLAAQKADYVFGGGLIVLAFALQLVSFFATNPVLLVSVAHAATFPWLALVGTVVAFVVFRLASGRLARHYQAQVEDVMRRQDEEHERKRKAQRDARKEVA